MRIVVKDYTLVVQIVYEISEPELKTTGNIMGVDLGIKCPAVSYCSDGSVHHANDRNYTCECGFHIHRDLLGAMNIERSTEFVGNRQTA